MTQKTFLKMKVVSLSAEIIAIRLEEIKWRDKGRRSRLGALVSAHDTAGKIRWDKKKYRQYKRPRATKPMKSFDHTGPDILRAGLCEHRLKLKAQVREAFLAYGFLRGRPYNAIENKTKNKPQWYHVIKNILRFSVDDERVLAQRFAEWIDSSNLPPGFKPSMNDASFSRKQKLRRRTILET